MQKKAHTLLAGLLIGSKMFAQQAPDTLLKHSPVRTLSDKQYTAYLTGAALPGNMALVAELNHYPLPDKIMQYKKELDLSPAQVVKLNEINKFLKLKRLEVGLSVIRNEKMLDSLFRTKKVDEGQVVFYGNRYGLYEGEFRTSLLLACYRTESVLTPQQIRKFEALQKHN